VTSKNKQLRRTAIEALSRGSGPAIEQIFVKLGAASIAKIPDTPFSQLDEDTLREIAEQGAIVFYSGKVLLKSDSEKFRNIGKQYFKKLRNHYSKIEDAEIATQAIQELDRELEREGVKLKEQSTSPAVTPTAPTTR